MSEYRRYYVPVGTFFFTVVTHERRPILAGSPGIDCLRAAFQTIQASHPFRIDAIVILPDHLHTWWAMPPGDADYSTRWRRIKDEFTKRFLQAGGTEGTRNRSRRRRKERGIWRRRFWEHQVRDEADFGRHADYIHYNPVKHGLVECPRDWPSFQRWVEQGIHVPAWGCAAGGVLRFDDLNETAME